MSDVRLILGDCLEAMGEIADGSVDLILCDPPYGSTACRWDQIIPFEPLWAHYRRLLKPRGAIVLTASQPFTSMLVMSNPKWFRHEWIWCKGMATGFLDAARKPMKAHESVLVFGDRPPLYTPQMETRTDDELKRERRNPRIYANPSSYARGEHVGRGRASAREKYPRSLISIKALTANSPERRHGKHPTQKPVALMEYLARTYSNEGDTVLDNAMGSGTTGVACANNGRDFVGIEKDPAYFAIAEKRIAAARADTASRLNFA